MVLTDPSNKTKAPLAHNNEGLPQVFGGEFRVAAVAHPHGLLVGLQGRRVGGTVATENLPTVAAVMPGETKRCP